MSKSPEFTITISLNVLNHLGINLYSSTPAVLSEVVANAWDADASQVIINLDTENESIEIIDDGHGMSIDDLNKKYLHVGYQRRVDNPLSENKQRKVMGRKGIGKLSLFSIADTVEVHSVKNSEVSGLIMSLPDIKSAITAEDPAEGHVYHPEKVNPEDIDITEGTKIIIKNMRKNFNSTASFLKKRIARRFSIIGQEYGFKVVVDGEEITYKDRDYYSKLQYVWLLGPESSHFGEYINNAEKIDTSDNSLEIKGVKHSVTGWIGTVGGSGDVKDGSGESLNKIAVIVRGKLAQDDILAQFGDAGLYTQYIVGEVHADFLDEDGKDDVATSSRQSLVEDDPRYQALVKYLFDILSDIRSKWTEYRNEDGVKEASQNPKIKKWLDDLDADTRNAANKIFGKINQLKNIDPTQKKELFAQSVIVVESFRYRKKLSALNEFDEITSENISLLSSVFAQIDEIEAVLYYRITKERMEIIDALQNKVANNEKEKFIQDHLYDHLWLLDPTWERATEPPIMEQSVKTAFQEINANLTEKEKRGRIDIRYKTSAGMNIIIELKRPDVKKSCFELLDQVEKYRSALKKCLEKAQTKDKSITVVCLVGQEPDDYNEEENIRMLEAKGTRIKTYNGLLEQAYKAYEQYTEQNREAGELIKFIDSLTDEL